MRLDLLTIGYRVEIRHGSVVIYSLRTDEMLEFPSIEAAKAWVIAELEAATPAGGA